MVVLWKAYVSYITDVADSSIIRCTLLVIVLFMAVSCYYVTITLYTIYSISVILCYCYCYRPARGLMDPLVGSLSFRS